MTSEKLAADAASRPADAVRIDLSQIWSYSRLPDLQMHDPDPTKSADAARAAKDAADAAKAAEDARSAEEIEEDRKEQRRNNPNLDQRLKKIKDVDPALLDYVFDIRDDKARTTKKYQAQIEEKDVELAKVKGQLEEIERKKLEESNAHKELYEREAEARKKTRAKLVDASIASQIAKRGYTEEGEKRAMKLIERQGIEVDSDDNVSGIGKAFDRMEEEWGDEMFRPKGRNSNADDDEEEERKPPKKSSKEVEDGESAAEYKRRQAAKDAGKDLPPSTGKKKTGWDARDPKVTDEERAARLEQIRR